MAIVGESGSGKSTLLHLMAGLDTPDEGAIHWGKTNLVDLTADQIASQRLSSIGLVFQAYYLMPHLNVIQNVELPFLLANQQVNRVRCEYLLNQVGLIDKAKAMPRHLSGGEQQRVAIARALALNPGIILADEPTGSLDAANSDKILDTLLTTCEAEGASLVMVTHSAKVAMRADKCWQLSDESLMLVERTT